MLYYKEYNIILLIIQKNIKNVYKKNRNSYRLAAGTEGAGC